jgi:hypothetical protein
MDATARDEKARKSDIDFKWICYDQIEENRHIVPDNAWIANGIDSGHCLISHEKNLVVTLESSGSDTYLTTVILCADGASVVVCYKGAAAIVNTHSAESKELPMAPCIGGKMFSDRFVVIWGFRKLICVMSMNELFEKEFDFGEIVDVYSDNENVICISINDHSGEKIVKVRLPRMSAV